MARRNDPTGAYWSHVNAASRSIIEQVLAATSNHATAASVLGVSRTFLIEKLQQHGIAAPRRPRVGKAK